MQPSPHRWCRDRAAPDAKSASDYLAEVSMKKTYTKAAAAKRQPLAAVTAQVVSGAVT